MNTLILTYDEFVESYKPIENSNNSIIFHQFTNYIENIKDNQNEYIFSLVKYGNEYFVIPGISDKNLIGYIFTKEKINFDEYLFIEVDKNRIHEELVKNDLNEAEC